MTAPAPSPAEQAVIDRSGIFDEERVVEEVARAIMDADYDQATGGLMAWSDLDGNEQDHYRRLAAAAVAVYRATQDGGAEEAVRRVEALAESWRYEGEHGWGAWQEGHGPDLEGTVLDQAATELRAALAPQAGDGAR